MNANWNSHADSSILSARIRTVQTVEWNNPLLSPWWPAVVYSEATKQNKLLLNKQFMSTNTRSVFFMGKVRASELNSWPLTLNIPSLGRQRCLPSWGPRRTPWFFFCNFSTVWCGRLLKLCFLGFWNYNSVIQALLVSNILCLFISTEVSQ